MRGIDYNSNGFSGKSTAKLRLTCVRPLPATRSASGSRWGGL